MTEIRLIGKTLVFNEKGELLVLQRAAWKERPEIAHTPDFPGGRADDDETERETAVREIEEEIGVTVSERDLRVAYTGSVMIEKEDTIVNRILFMVYLDYTPEIKLSAEHESYKWIDPKEAVKTEKFVGFYAEALEFVVKNGII